MNTYEVRCLRRNGATTPVRSVTFYIDADTEGEAETQADVRLSRMRDFSHPELDIDSVHEVTA